MQELLRPLSVFSILFALYAYQDDGVIVHYLIVTSALNLYVAWVRVNVIEELIALFGILMAMVSFDVVQRSLIPFRMVLTRDYATVQIYMHMLSAIFMIDRMFE
jgi:hypothetical protein